MSPGEAVSVFVALEPISVVVRTGDRIRVSIAGFDASSFRPGPGQGNPVFTFARHANEASYLELPMSKFSLAGGVERPPGLN